MPRLKTIRAFGEWVKDDANIEALLSLVANGATLQKACLAVKQPYTLLHPYLHEKSESMFKAPPGTKERYLAARQAWADLQEDEAKAIADSVKPEIGPVAKAKLQCEVRRLQAKAYHRERWGESIKVEKDVKVSVDAALIGFAADLLLKAKRAPLTIENAPGQAPDAASVGTEPPAVALPAPAGRE